MTPFNTKRAICGDFKKPLQMLDDQTYDGHVSIHDSKMAEDLGFSGAPIEGPTHFSQFDPLMVEIYGQKWFESGCISSHFLNMVVEGEEVRAFVELPEAGKKITNIWAEKRDGTPVLSGTASIGTAHPESELDRRRAKLNPSEQLVILSDVNVGMKGKNEELVIMDFDQNMGHLYPFSLNNKLQTITENSPWYSQSEGAHSPWGRAVIPMEMLSVLSQYTSNLAEFPIKQPSVGLFADLEIKLINGPLFVNQPYRLEREIVTLSESRRVESYWVKTSIFEQGSDVVVAECMLNHAIMKDSYEKYKEDAEALGKAL